MDAISPLAYCPNFAAVTKRLRSLYERRAFDQVFAVMETPSPALERFAQQHTEGYCAYPGPAERLAFWDEHLARKASRTIRQAFTFRP